MHGVGEGNRPTTYPQKWIDTVSQLDQVAFELREHLKHYRFRRLDLVGIVNLFVRVRRNTTLSLPFLS